MAGDYSAATGANWEDAFAAPMSAKVPPALGGLRLDQALAKMFPQYSRNRLQAWVRSGHIRIDGARGESSRPVAGGEAIDIAPPTAPQSGAPAAQRMPLKIVFEDRDLVVIDKPAGLVVHPGAGVPDRTLLNALLAHAPEVAAVPRAGIVHRLDKDTSGLLVVAKNVVAQAKLAEQLATRAVRRIYLALVHGDPPASGVIDAPVGRDVRARTQARRLRRRALGRRARTARGEQPDPDRARYATLVRQALARAIGRLPARDRLRFGCYYVQDLTLAQTGRVMHESEATSSRQLARARTEIRRDVERQLQGEAGLTGDQIAACFAAVAEDPGPLDLKKVIYE